MHTEPALTATELAQLHAAGVAFTLLDVRHLDGGMTSSPRPAPPSHQSADHLLRAVPQLQR